MTTSAVLSRCVSRLGAAVTSSGSSTRAASTNTTLDEKEVDKFSRMMKDWWDPVNGSAVGLHSMNDLRVPLIRDGLAQTRLGRTDGQAGPEPLAGTRILDVGCGGGILSESLARLGAQVVGIDATGDAIQAAQSHLQKDQVGDIIFLEVSRYLPRKSSWSFQNIGYIYV